MPRLDTRWTRPGTLLLVGLLAALALSAGCSGKTDTVTLHFTPDVVAVTAADSVAAGQGLEVKIHWRSTGTCQTFEGVAFQPVDDTTFSALAVANEVRDPKKPCTARDTVLEGGFVLKDPPARRFRVLVYGARQLDTVFVTGGASPASIERHSFRMQNAADGSPVEGGVIDIVDVASSTVIGSLSLNSLGLADTAFACAGVARSYELRVTGPLGRRATLEFQARPQRCGVPERTWIRL